MHPCRLVDESCRHCFPHCMVRSPFDISRLCSPKFIAMWMRGPSRFTPAIRLDDGSLMKQLGFGFLVLRRISFSFRSPRVCWWCGTLHTKTEGHGAGLITVLHE